MDIELTLDPAMVEAGPGYGLTFWSSRGGDAPGISASIDRGTWEALGSPMSITLTAPDPQPPPASTPSSLRAASPSRPR